jgi:hypothetical protein
MQVAHPTWPILLHSILLIGFNLSFMMKENYNSKLSLKWAGLHTCFLSEEPNRKPNQNKTYMQ